MTRLSMRRLNTLVYLYCLLLFISIAYIALASDSDEGNTYFGDDIQKSTESCTKDSCAEVTAHEEHSSAEPINVIITFTNAPANRNLQDKFEVTVSSLLKHTTVPLALHIIGEKESQELAANIIKRAAPEAASKYKLVNLDVGVLADKLQTVVRPMQEHFSYKAGSKYNHPLFFLSIAMHRVMDESMKRVIMLDADLKFMADIAELYQQFELFGDSAIMGLGHEMQPVYKHMLHRYRSKHPDSRVGMPPPDGLTGFNSGVTLLDLEKMRKSELYNSLLNPEAVQTLTDKYEMKGHLGDQDFFSLLSFEYEALVHVLPCGWNRQLCTWWFEHGYAKLKEEYFDSCSPPVKIYHGNCNTPIPDS